MHGGAAEMRAMLGAPGGVPYDDYFQAVDDALKRHSDARILGCSDSSDVIDQIRMRYGERAIFYPATRSAYGEMHESRPENEGSVFPKYKLGLDVIIEAHLLARCVHFVHGISHVSNHILCLAPDMPNTYVYAGLEDEMRRKALAALEATNATTSGNL